jgi:hypothetical protein
MGVNYSIGGGGWAGVVKHYPAPQDWSAYEKVSFWVYGSNNGAPIRLEILDNGYPGTSGDSYERFEYKFTDNFIGWKSFDLTWSAFTRRSDWQPYGAPNDGFNRTQIWGFNFSPINGQGSFQVDQIQLLKP